MVIVRVGSHWRGKTRVSSYRRHQLVNRGKFGLIKRERAGAVKEIRGRFGRFKGSKPVRKGFRLVRRESRAGRILGTA